MALPYPLTNRQNQRFSERSRLKVCLYDTFSGITFIYTERIWFFSAGLNFLKNCLSGLDKVSPREGCYESRTSSESVPASCHPSRGRSLSIHERQIFTSPQIEAWQGYLFVLLFYYPEAKGVLPGLRHRMGDHLHFLYQAPDRGEIHSGN